MLVIAKQSNVNKGEVSLKHFVPVTKEKKVKVVSDLTFNGKTFLINKSFLEGQTENQGWNVSLDIEGEDEIKGIYLLQSKEGSGIDTVFLKGKGATFTSDVLVFAIEKTGGDLNTPFYLNKVDAMETDDYIAYEISKTESTVENTVVDHQAEVDALAEMGVEEVYNESLQEEKEELIYQ